jgi:GT2 family glycosyltransferase
MTESPDQRPEQPAVTAVVLNYNGAELLEVVLPSLERQTYPRLSTLVVDNGSTDGSVARVRDRWPAARVTEIPQNVGVAKALNRGIAASDTELVALLNNDIELEPNWLEELVATLLQRPRAASASGKLLRFTDRDTIDAAGDLMRWSGACVNRGAGEPDDGRYEQVEPVFSACAGAALYRREAFEVVGPFDEDFYAYMEDADWGLRARLQGLESIYVPSARAYHVRGATTSRAKPRYIKFQRRNQLLFVLKNYPAGALVRHLPEVLAVNLALILQDARHGLLRSNLAGWWEALEAVPRTLRKRRAIQRRRAVELADLDGLIEPEPWARGSLGGRLSHAARAIKRLFAN